MKLFKKLFLKALNKIATPFATYSLDIALLLSALCFSSQVLAEKINFSRVWSEGHLSISQNFDLSAYQALEMDLNNTTAKTLTINLILKDSLSKDYWSRVNHTLTIPPGEHHFRIPLNLHVGDVSRIGRLIDLKKIVNITVERVPLESKGEILIAKVEAVKEKTWIKEGVLAFDFGGPDTPVFQGFQAVNEKTLYTPQLGFGLISPKIWHPYPQANDSLQPDSLYRDALFLPSGQFRVDLPNDHYEVHLNLDFSSGYWGEFPLFHKRQVKAQGQIVVNQSLDRNAAADKYFLFSRTEDREEEDFFQKYYSKIFKEHIFDVNVKNGSLILDFSGDDCLYSPCFGMAVTSLIVFPKNKAKEKKEFLQWLTQERKKEFQQNFTFISNAEKNATPVKKMTFFHWPFMAELPQKIGLQKISELQDLKATLLKKHSTSISFALLSEKDLKSLSVKIEAQQNKSPLVQNHFISRRLSRHFASAKTFTLAERYFKPENQVSAKANEPLRLWLDINSADIAAGTYKYQLIVNADKKIYKIPLQVKILDFELPELDIPVGPFNSSIQENWWFEKENDFRENKLFEESLDAMRAHGLNSFSFFAKLDVNWSKSPVEIKNIDNITQIMNKAKKAGFKSLVAYNSVLQDLSLCTADLSSTQLQSWTQTLKMEAQKKSWLPLTILVCDEPIGDDLNKAIERTQLLQNFSSPEVQFSTAFSIEPHEKRTRELFQASNLPFLALYPLQDLMSTQKNWVYYNFANRRSFGFGMFKLRQQTQLQGRLAWNWNQNAGNPYFALDAREDDINWCNSLRDGQLMCSVFLKRHIQEGLNDYRLALLVQKLKPESPILKNILSLKEESKEASPGETKNLYQEDDDLRNQIFLSLEKMTEEIKVKEKIK